MMMPLAKEWFNIRNVTVVLKRSVEVTQKAFHFFINSTNQYAYRQLALYRLFRIYILLSAFLTGWLVTEYWTIV